MNGIYVGVILNDESRMFFFRLGINGNYKLICVFKDKYYVKNRYEENIER